MKLLITARYGALTLVNRLKNDEKVSNILIK